MMHRSISALLVVSALLAAGCTSPRQDYVSQHPELTAEHRKIMLSGQLTDHAPVAGMTRDQIQLAMGVEPAQYTKVDGQDAWVYVTKKLSPMNLSDANDATFNHQDNRSRHSLAEGESHAPSDQPTVKTTVYFQGNVATKADVVNGGL